MDLGNLYKDGGKQLSCISISMVSFTRALIAIGLLAAMSNAAAEDRESTGRLLQRAEGLVLAGRALEYPALSPWPDCSHLVHELLNEAGLEYPYATSNEIYMGVSQFRRVRRPQPGDLIVWRGHMGLVVDTQNRRFFSSTESGPRTDNYESDYWRGRGIPRFYRYVVNNQTQLVAHAPVRGPKKNISDAPIESGTGEDVDEAATRGVPEPVVAYRTPESLTLETRGRKPSKADVARAIEEYTRTSAPALESENRGDHAIILVRRIQVKKVHIKGGLGWTEIRFDSRAQLVPDGTWSKSKAEKVRWSLRPDEDGWKLVLPQDRVYIAQDAAIPSLARELDVLSEKASVSNRTRASALAAVLNLLSHP